MGTCAGMSPGFSAREYLSRAQEGLDRQAAIVAAMSEAQRLEGSVRTADWETINLGEMLSHSIDAYRSVNPSRHRLFYR